MKYSTPSISSSAYNAFQNQSIESNRSDLEVAAEALEAVFIEQLMKAMRQSIPKSEMGLESSSADLYQSMLDSELSQQMAHHSIKGRGMGLAKLIIDYMDSPQSNNNQVEED